MALIGVWGPSPPAFMFTATMAKGTARQGDVFTEPTVTAEDATNAAKLGPLGYVASPTTAWPPGAFMTVSGFRFSWTGAAWAAGPRPGGFGLMAEQYEDEEAEEEEDAVPNERWLKADIQEWLEARDVEVDPGWTKAELLDEVAGVEGG